MAWWNRNQQDLVALQGAATILSGPSPDLGLPPQQRAANYAMLRARVYRVPDQWQREVWDFYDSLGEFRQGIGWKANMLSRVRLKVGRQVPGQDEPTLLEDGPAVDILRELAGGVGGQAQLMSGFAVYLDVPGECYMIGETLPNGKNSWYTRSIEEVRPAISVGPMHPADPLLGGQLFQVSEGWGRWRVLPQDSMVVRVHRPHKRWHNVADSPAKAARPLLRELELLNRHIQSQYMSRLASAGVIIFPDEVSFPVRPEFADEPDPFVREWIEIAAEAIATPGTASATIPIPIKVPGEYVDKVKFIDFTLKLDSNIVQKRDSALSRLAIALDMPPEALLGMRDVNHWNAWLIDEQGIKIHVAPDAEIVCDALTTGYLHPRLEAIGESTEDLVVWYDASELILRPDRTKATFDAYDRGEASGKTLRYTIGMDETDKPTDSELQDITLKKIALTQPVNALAALQIMFPGLNVPEPAPADAPRPDGAPPAPSPDKTPGKTEGPTAPESSPSNGNGKGNGKQSKAASDELAIALVKQARAMHGLKIDFEGAWTLMHPQGCSTHLFSCPVTHATWKPIVDVRPGQSGTYQCWLNPHGQPIIGERMTDTDAEGMLPSMTQIVP